MCLLISEWTITLVRNSKHRPPFDSNNDHPALFQHDPRTNHGQQLLRSTIDGHNDNIDFLPPPLQAARLEAALSLAQGDNRSQNSARSGDQNTRFLLATAANIAPGKDQFQRRCEVGLKWIDLSTAFTVKGARPGSNSHRQSTPTTTTVWVGTTPSYAPLSVTNNSKA
ncbi:hypothetical protein MIND_01128100 [Mycena indigotica]|uniref:Uncharacterized protein n=1 Tax=Mycena indigotica TaxID=2126181 RepID=A0A8H6S7G7_9AGAR|nr:uncharacterized protein MIND_01128100 [Mycena indigotica]KAF7293501.1 hypothetical protein MIND_01128100 [Mycena indigotica]